jgi:hypothetical protein
LSAKTVNCWALTQQFVRFCTEFGKLAKKLEVFGLSDYPATEGNKKVVKSGSFGALKCGRVA